MQTEQEAREEMAALAGSLFQRGFSVGGAGNISSRLADGSILLTPTSSSLGRLRPERLSKLAPDGTLLSGDPPSKEAPVHLVFYQGNGNCGAVVHLHSTYLTALSCLDGLDPDDVIRPFTPYYVMRVDRLSLIPYYKPGSPGLANELDVWKNTANAFLLANHGAVVTGKNLVEAVNNAEELEETAKLHFILSGKKVRYLSESEIADLRKNKKEKPC